MTLAKTDIRNVEGPCQVARSDHLNREIVQKLDDLTAGCASIALRMMRIMTSLISVTADPLPAGIPL